VMGERACTYGEVQMALAPEDRLVGPDGFDDIDCDRCKATPYYAAADRIAMENARASADFFRALAGGAPRISRALGDRSVIKPGMTKGEQLKAVHETFTDEERAEAMHRWADQIEDTCPSCGGSIGQDDHSDDCRGPDPARWDLTDEEIRADLLVQGIDPDAAAKRFRAILDGYQREAEARIRGGHD